MKYSLFAPVRQCAVQRAMHPWWNRSTFLKPAKVTMISNTPCTDDMVTTARPHATEKGVGAMLSSHTSHFVLDVEITQFVTSVTSLSRLEIGTMMC